MYQKKIILNLKKKKKIKNNILILGCTFKENCPDIRNSQVKNLSILISKKVSKVDIFDPWVNEKILFSNKKIKQLENFPKNKYDSIIISVAHNIFQKIGATRINNLVKKKSIVLDLKNLFKKNTFL